MEHWTFIGLQQKICQIELVAVLFVRYFYRNELSNSSALYFVDNEAARFCLIKGSSPALSMYNICRAVSLVEAEFPSASWYERVASESNIADPPSGSKLKNARQSREETLQAIYACLKQCSWKLQESEALYMSEKNGGDRRHDLLT
jgi:hypothetical protein